MSGARLEAAGQVRNSFPFICDRAATVNITVVTGVPAIVAYARQAIPYPDDIPFDRGPDKSGRIFPVISAVSVILTAGTAGTGNVIGNLFYNDGFNDLLLTSLVNADPYPQYRSNDRYIIPRIPVFGANVDNIGYIVWRDVASLLGTAATIIARVNFNIGFYGEYAEFDFNELKQKQPQPLVDMSTLDQ